MTDTTPMAVNRTLPRRQPNAAYRQREYLTESEVERLVEAARKRGRSGSRDAAAILLAYRHGLRAQELCSLRWAPCGRCRATHRMCSSRRQALLLPELGSCECCNEPVAPRSFRSQSTLTCCVMPADISSPTMATTRGHSLIISGIATCNQRRVTLRQLKGGLHNSGRTNSVMSRPLPSTPEQIYVVFPADTGE